MLREETGDVDPSIPEPSEPKEDGQGEQVHLPTRIVSVAQSHVTRACRAVLGQAVMKMSLRRTNMD